MKAPVSGDASTGEPTAGRPIEGESFPPRVRLRRAAEFRLVLARGWRVHGEHLVVHFLSTQTGSSRLGLTVSRRVGNSVARNRMRRWIKEMFRRRLRASMDDSGVSADMLVRPRPGTSGVGHADLERELLEAVSLWEKRRSKSCRPDRRTRRGAPPRNNP